MPLRENKLEIMDTVLEKIGHTPLVRLNKIPQSEGLECEFLVKCEYLNAGGSVKDRIARRMIEDAEKSGRIKPGDTLIEPTSGNTGIGLALAAAIKGYKMIITMPEKMSQQKVDVLRALGAEIIRTPTSAAWDSPDSHISVAIRLNKEIPNSHILDQYSNPSNPLAHYEETAEEILQACNDKLDMIVGGAGTGGTMTGIGRRIKERCPSCIVVGVDPFGSILAPDELNATTITGYQVEGIGYDFLPRVFDRAAFDYWTKSEDKESFIMARRLLKEEGLLCGGSSGTALYSAIKVAKAKGLGKGQRVVVILPDSTRNYMSKFIKDEWMAHYAFVDSFADKEELYPKFRGTTVKSLNIAEPVTVSPSTSSAEVIEILNTRGFSQLPVVDNGIIVGQVNVNKLLDKISNGQLKGSDPISLGMEIYNFPPITPLTKLSDLSAFFERYRYCFVTRTETDKHIVGVVTKIDLLQFLYSN